MCSRSSTRLTLPWSSSRGRLSARRSAPGWIPRSSRPLLLVGVLLPPWFAVEPPLRPPPLLLSRLSVPSALSLWPVTRLPPLRPRPRLVPRVRRPRRLFPCLLVWMLKLPWPISAFPPPHLNPFSRRCRPNALLLPFPPLSALRLVPVVLRGLRLTPPLPPPCVPATPTAGPHARSTSLGIPLPFGLSPTPSPPLPHPLSIHWRSTPGSGCRSTTAPTAPGILLDTPIDASTCAVPTFRPTLPHLAPSLLTPNRRLLSLPSPVSFTTFFGPTPLRRYLPPFFYALCLPPFVPKTRDCM